AGDRFLLALPCHFSFGLVAGLLAPLRVQADVVLTEHPISVDSWRAALERHAVSVFSATPSLMRRLLPAAPFPASLRTITIGGDAVVADELRRLRAAFAGEVYLTYGLSEAGPRVFTRRLPAAAHEIGPAALHVGAAFPGVETRLCEPTRHGGVESGELALLTPTAMLGRWDGAALVREDFDDAWLRTGDVFTRDARGALTFSARKKELIVVGGEKIGAALIRRVLLEHASVVAARVWPEPHAELGAVPVAAVRYRDGADKPSSAELTRWAAARLRRIELPRHIGEDANLPISFK
ncbi:MAG TPA: fatty acid--CoA ligase family protein, partial [Duganella sp.]|uniref:class I adenylate-forming enzyme family protein n=1 Tax=Duganella sp. TaxID=1904440 RepID=UPI002ED46F1A